MNRMDIDEARVRWRNHPLLGPATQTLTNLRDFADNNSDGWPYWRKPSAAAAKLMELIEGDGTWAFREGSREDVTVAKLRAAYAPIKAFRTREKAEFDIIEL